MGGGQYSANFAKSYYILGAIIIALVIMLISPKKIKIIFFILFFLCTTRFTHITPKHLLHQSLMLKVVFIWTSKYSTLRIYEGHSSISRASF